MYVLLAIALVASVKQPDVFLAVGRAQGTYATQVGYPGTPTREQSISTREVFLDIRGNSGFISGSVQFPKRPFTGTAWEAKFRFNPLAIGPLRVGIGAQTIHVPSYNYEIPTQAYVRILSRHERMWGAGVADVGIGSYSHSYARAIFVYGAIRTPTETDVVLFDQPFVLEHTGFGQAASRMRGIGIEGRLEPIRNGVLSGSVTRFDRQSVGSALVPDHHWVATGEASYMTPWHVGVMVSGTHATDGLGLAFPNNTLRLRLGLSF
jgi:hypothetical protein